jgi:hypothetical protein
VEIITREFNVSIGDEINIYFIGDIHEGNVNHAEAEFIQAVDIIKNDPNGWWIGMGDYAEAITTDDKKRFNPITIAEKYNIRDLKDLPFKQAEVVYGRFKPIEDRCLCLLLGNHEETYIKHNNSDIYARFVEMFTNPPPKVGYVGFLRLVLKTLKGKPMYSPLIALNHGDGGGGFREGYPINKLWDVFRWVDADVSVMGHVHRLMEDDKKFIGVTWNGKLKKSRRYVGISGCFLWTYKEGNMNYFEHKGRNESDIGMLKCTLKVEHPRHGLDISMHKIKLG